MRFRTIKREIGRMFAKSIDRQFREHKRRANELEAEFATLHATLPSFNVAIRNAGDDLPKLVETLRALSANFLASAAVVSQWADEIESASKLVRQ